jgi:DNA-directed RNA polymerase subunit RPC12/RpoP
MLTYRCRKCGKTYPAKVNYPGKLEDIDPDEHEARCPFCSQWNRAERPAKHETPGAGRDLEGPPESVT